CACSRATSASVRRERCTCASTLGYAMLDSTPAIATPTSPSISVNPRSLRDAWAAPERQERRCDADMDGSFRRSASGIAGDRARGRARPHPAEDVDDVTHRAAADVAE